MVPEVFLAGLPAPFAAVRTGLEVALETFFLPTLLGLAFPAVLLALFPVAVMLLDLPLCGEANMEAMTGAAPDCRDALLFWTLAVWTAFF